MRRTAQAARVDAECRVPTWWGGMEASKAGNLVMGWVDEFADVVLAPDAYTGSAADPEYIRKHVRSADALRKLKARAKDPTPDLEMVVVCDLWLTGFDSPALHTMHLAKLMKGHGLFQAITARTASTRTSHRG